MEEAFVYKWTNLSEGKIYIGYHKGKIDDGYICSSKSQDFWDDFKDDNIKWERKILFKGSVEECVNKEVELLRQLDIKSDFVYNNACGGKIIFTREVREKISLASKGRKISEETRQKMKDAWNKRLQDKSYVHHRKNQSLSDETRKKMSIALMGNINSKGNKFSDESRKKVSESLKGNTRARVNKGKKHNEEWVNNQAESQRGQKWFNNGKINRKFHPGKEIEGFKLGKLKINC